MIGQRHLDYTPWLERCCKTLERRTSSMPSDRVLPWLVRYQVMVAQTTDLRKLERDYEQNASQIGLMIRGMAAQMDEWRGNMPEEVAANREPLPLSPSLFSPAPPHALTREQHTPAAIQVASLFAPVWLYGAPLLKFPNLNRRGAARNDASQDPARLVQALKPLRAFLDHTATLQPGSGAGGAAFNAFSCVDWSRFILAIVLAFRLSLPIASCPAWDHGAARRELEFGKYLRLLSRESDDGDDDDDDDSDGRGARRRHHHLTPATSAMGVVAASRAVLGVVRQKFDRRLAVLESPAATTAVPSTAAGLLLGPGVSGCPMHDGSMDPLWDMWDETYPADPTLLAGELPHDLWATMTMSWSQDGAGVGDVDFSTYAP